MRQKLPEGRAKFGVANIAEKLFTVRLRPFERGIEQFADAAIDLWRHSWRRLNKRRPLVAGEAMPWQCASRAAQY